MQLDKEPAFNLGLITGVVQSGLAMLVGFGFDLSAEQITYIVAFVAAVGPLVQGFVTRSIVFAPKTVKDMFYSEGHQQVE